MADQARQPLFRFGGDGMDAFLDHPSDQRVNKRPERLDQIVGQREAVKAVVVVQPDCRVKPRADDRPCDAGSHDSVAIVQKGIWTIGILIPTEIAPQQSEESRVGKGWVSGVKLEGTRNNK